MAINESDTNAEVVTVARPFRCPVASAKCCCFQIATFSSNGNELGSIKEDCWFCVPSFKLFDYTGAPVYKLHPPTCCCGMCINCFAEGNPCGKGCCKQSFRIYPADQSATGGNAPYIGRIMKKPKSLATELFTEADAFECDFPADATADQKGLMIGTTIFINTNFFEGGIGG